jgi:hypothetical protein
MKRKFPKIGALFRLIENAPDPNFKQKIDVFYYGENFKSCFWLPLDDNIILMFLSHKKRKYDRRYRFLYGEEIIQWATSGNAICCDFNRRFEEIKIKE